MQQTRAAPPATLDAVLERITYANQETGYTVARVATARSSDLLTVVGPLLGAQPGEGLRLRGRWASHPQYGRQFQVEAYDTVLPATIQGIRRYLGSGLIKGIGPKMAERIVDHFGQATLEVIEQAPGRLVEVPGLGPKRTAMITAAWAEQQAIKEVMVFLQGMGVSTSLGVRIYKTYRDEAIEVVRREPYRLAADVWGIGFKTADQIARSLGIPHDSPQRVRAGLQFALSEATEDGHCYLPETELVAAATELLGVETGLAERCLEELVAEEGVVAEPLPTAAVSPGLPEGTGRAIWLVPFHRAERALAAGLLRLLEDPADRLAWSQTVDWTVALDWLRRTTGVTLAPEQEAAVRLALTERVAVLTGGPGCGKSYTVRAVVTLALAKHAKILLAAPTGRAAKRLSELAGLEAATLHRLLQLRPGGDAAFDRDHPLDADLVVVDEASMLDVLLANKLVKAIPPGAHLLFVGDVDQLPSVGAGEVLRDLLGANRLPRVRLTHIFRQAQQSGVVTNAHRINAGQHPITSGLDDFFFFPEEDAEQVADLVVDIVANRLPRRFGLDPRQEIQVLCPMHRGPAGAGALNERLQAALTPAREGLAERRFGGRVYRVGDKVMQLRNNYDKGTAGVFNGSVGQVTAISLEDQELRVRLDEDEEVGYGFDELDELTHAYAVSIHRAQGSEYPCVVIPLTMSAWLMLQRNLLYTAVTRAKRMVVLVGSRRALAKAIRTQGAGRRYTALAERLRPGPVGARAAAR
ncbi:MAG TPA: ATP-dependent RecD-like DNA helicase [Actinomycetes bacterium]|nr:ATP-dependent RecD-like DNA helicase [Actinomycetes bacterium]